MSLVKPSSIHHAAYRCKDAKETVEWYGRVLDMEYTTAFAEDHVPSTGAYDPYMHVFLDAGNGNVLAFFELPNQPDMGRDENTPQWVQHLAFRVNSETELLAAKDHIEGLGIDVLGPTHHGIFKSIYFFDPNGHRVELAADIGTDEQKAGERTVNGLWDLIGKLVDSSSPTSTQITSVRADMTHHDRKTL